LAPLACQLLDAELLATTINSFLASCSEAELPQPPALLLLEADQLPAAAQPILADLLAERQPRLRTLATARVPLLTLAADEQFHRGLAYALSTLVIEVPPLAERVEDIPLLAQLFLEERNADADNQLAGFTEDAREQLLAYPWPGNVDELAELVREACAAAPGPLVAASDLPERIRLTADAAAHPPRPDERIVLDEFLAEIEQELLQRALRQAKGNKAQAARLLGVSRPRLLRRLEYFHIQ
jgi:DNA-binding NtrC family response regulator